MSLVVEVAGDADKPLDAQTAGSRLPTLDNPDRELEVFESATLAVHLALVLETWLFHLQVSVVLTVSPGWGCESRETRYEGLRSGTCAGIEQGLGEPVMAGGKPWMDRWSH